MSITQPQRLSYTRRDLISYHDDVTKYIKHFISRVTDASEMNSGRLYLTLIEALIDNGNFGLDQGFLEATFKNTEQRKNILRACYTIGYNPTSVSTASVDLTYAMQSGVAGIGGKAIPIYTRNQTTVSPIIEFFTVEAAVIPEGEVSVSGVPAIQGIRVTGEILAAAADGSPNQTYVFVNAKTPHSLVEVYVNGRLWDRVDDWMESNEGSEHYRLEFDEDDYTHVVFGDGEVGKIPPIGASITTGYVYCVAEQGNIQPETIRRIVGSLASDVLVTHTIKASGGAPSESNDSIKRNAPAFRRTFERIVSRPDHEAQATNVEGVYKAFASKDEGARTNVYIMPEGGGTASSYLVGQVQARFDAYKLDGAVPVAYALNAAQILIGVNVVTFDNKIQKSAVRTKVTAATIANLVYTKLTRGRAFTQSDLSGIYEAIDDGKLLDYVDFTLLSRVPRVTKSNVSAPDFIGRVKIFAGVDYDEYLVSALSTTEFVVSKNGIPQTVQGTVATEYTTDEEEVKFTLGLTGDTFTVGDTWRFKTSRYVDNIVIDADEFMELEKSSDLSIAVFYPGEYSLRTKSGV